MTGDFIAMLLITWSTPYCHINNIASYFCSLLHKCWYSQHFWFLQLLFYPFWGRRQKTGRNWKANIHFHGVLPDSHQSTPPFLFNKQGLLFFKCLSSIPKEYFQKRYFCQYLVLIIFHLFYQNFIWIWSFLKWLRQKKDVL